MLSPTLNSAKVNIGSAKAWCLVEEKPLPEPELTKIPGGRLNKKDGLTRYGDSHVKDKTS